MKYTTNYKKYRKCELCKRKVGERCDIGYFCKECLDCIIEVEMEGKNGIK